MITIGWALLAATLGWGAVMLFAGHMAIAAAMALASVFVGHSLRQNYKTLALSRQLDALDAAP